MTTINRRFFRGHQVRQDAADGRTDPLGGVGVGASHTPSSPVESPKVLTLSKGHAVVSAFA